MAMTSAERQAAYRARLRSRAPETLEAGIERERQTILTEWASELDAEDNPEAAALVRDVAAQPARTGERFSDWLSRLLVRDIEDDISRARKAMTKSVQRMRPPFAR